MNPTDVKLDEVLADKDDNLEVIATEEKPKAEDGSDVESTEDGDNGVEEAGTKPDDSEESEGDGFTANEYEEEKPEAEPEKPAEAPQLNPELKYIVDNLPLVSVRIMQDGQPKEVQIKSFTQLPADVEFASPRDALAFQNAMTAQEIKAQQLQGEFRQRQQATQTSEFEARENAAIREDITELQNAKLLPTFKVKPDEAGFESDPAAKEVQSVLDFMNGKNQEYLTKYNNGGAYRHIGFAEAYYMMPKTQERNANREAQKTEDADRKKVAGRVSGSTGLTNTNPTAPRVRRGMSLDEIVERAEQTL